MVKSLLLFLGVVECFVTIALMVRAALLGLKMASFIKANVSNKMPPGIPLYVKNEDFESPEGVSLKRAYGRSLLQVIAMMATTVCTILIYRYG